MFHFCHDSCNANQSAIRCSDIIRKDGGEKKFPPFPSMEVVEAEVSKKSDGMGGEKQRLHNTSRFHKC